VARWWDSLPLITVPYQYTPAVKLTYRSRCRLQAVVLQTSAGSALRALTPTACFAFFVAALHVACPIPLTGWQSVHCPATAVVALMHVCEICRCTHCESQLSCQLVVQLCKQHHPFVWMCRRAPGPRPGLAATTCWRAQHVPRRVAHGPVVPEPVIHHTCALSATPVCLHWRTQPWCYQLNMHLQGLSKPSIHAAGLNRILTRVTVY
jgi:hypothetical protein